VRDISGAIQELREILMDLRPPAFEEMSLGELIFWYAQQFAGKTGIQITVEGAASLPPVNKLLKENLFRICQEAFGNAARHSGASFVSAIFRYEDSMLSLMVQDNGHGFSLSSLAEKEKGLGLQTMKERTELLGGYFLVKSSPEGGTEIFVEVRLT
jgi:signal transduction histidine kinase